MRFALAPLEIAEADATGCTVATLISARSSASFAPNASAPPALRHK